MRKPAGAHVVESNGYLTLTNHAAFPDVKIAIMPRWRKACFLGTSNMSKTVVPSHFGDERINPVRSYMVLRAWMIWRATENKFSSERSSSRVVFAKEIEKLRASILLASSAAAPTTGDDNADKLIRQWVPQVLVAG